MKKSLFGKAVQRKKAVSAPGSVAMPSSAASAAASTADDFSTIEDDLPPIVSSPTSSVPSLVSPFGSPFGLNDGTFEETVDSSGQKRQRSTTAEKNGRPEKRRKKDGDEGDGEVVVKPMTLGDLLKRPKGKHPRRRKSTTPEEENGNHFSAVEVRKELERDGFTKEKIESPSSDESSSSNYCPNVRVVDGNIVIEDHGSLVMPQRTAEHSDYKIVNEQKAHITSRSFSKYKSTEKWTEEETNLFYDGLRQCGTDFSLLQMLFPKRTRRQIRNKFKREESINAARINNALMDKKPIETEKFCFAEKGTGEKKENEEIPS